jgi:hypothetical protein
MFYQLLVNKTLSLINNRPMFYQLIVNGIVKGRKHTYSSNIGVCSNRLGVPLENKCIQWVLSNLEFYTHKHTHRYMVSAFNIFAL